MTYDDRYDRNDRYEDDYQYQEYQDYQYEDDYDYPADKRQWLLVRALRAEWHRGGRNRGLDTRDHRFGISGRQPRIPGPGTTSITAHIAASVVALAAQIWCDRRRGIAAVAGSVVVLVVAGLLLVTQWWG